MSLPPDTLNESHIETCELCSIRPGELFCAQWIRHARRLEGARDDGGGHRGFRIFADVLLDVSRYHVDGTDGTPAVRPTMNPAERAAAQILDVFRAAGIPLCGSVHVSRLHRQVNAQTGETRWVI